MEMLHLIVINGSHSMPNYQRIVRAPSDSNKTWCVWSSHCASKAFNRMPHDSICNKFCYNGIRGPLLFWMKHYLTDRQQKVIIDGASSYSSRVTSGVLQGMVLTAPLFFYVL